MTTAAFRTVYRTPFILSTITIAGLLSALLGDGVWDALSWGLLAIPMFLLSFFLVRRKKSS